MLLGNYSVLHKSPGKWTAGTIASGDRANWGKSGMIRSALTDAASSGTYWKLASIPYGHFNGGAWRLPIKAGGITSRREARGDGSLAVTGQLAKETTATLTGSGTVTTAALGLIVSAVATLTGSGTVSAALSATLQAAATLAGQGSLSAAMGALAGALATLSGNGTLEGTLKASGDLSATISTLVELSPEALTSEIMDAPIENGMTLREALRLIAAATAGKVSGAGGTTVTIRSAVADDKDRIVATTDASGNRSAITYDAT